MQGSNSYLKMNRSVPQPSPSHPPLVKRQRVHYKHEGSNKNIEPTLEMLLDQGKESFHKSLRHAIYYYFIYHLDAPHEEHWGGKEGTISLIRKHLCLPPHTRRKICRTLQCIIHHIRTGTPFTGNYESHAGRKVLIESGSTEEELIARWMEAHLGFRMTTMLVNEHRREEGEERVSVSAVVNAFYWLEPKINIIEKVQSGGLNAAWLQASYNISKQMQIMLGKISMEEIMTDQEGRTVWWIP